jgi:hypothetical protein
MIRCLFTLSHNLTELSYDELPIWFWALIKTCSIAGTNASGQLLLQIGDHLSTLLGIAS